MGAESVRPLLDHGDWTKVGIAGALCSAVPAGEAVVPAVLYVGGWVLMLTAMMLPPGEHTLHWIIKALAGAEEPEGDIPLAR